MDDKSTYKLNMALPNGIILGLIGLLVLLTPLTTEVPEHQLLMDVIAGAVLFTGGMVSLIKGLYRRDSSG